MEGLIFLHVHGALKYEVNMLVRGFIDRQRTVRCPCDATRNASTRFRKIRFTDFGGACIEKAFSIRLHLVW